jgi:DNA-binding NarL/FixJ family response regulator
MANGVGSRRSSSIRVLIADDEPIMRDVARMACQEHGTEVVGEVSTGLDAVQETLRLRPDVLVLDLDLQDVDGFEVSRRLREAGCATRILGTTGEGGPPAVFRALRTGIGGLLTRLGMGSGLPEALRSLAEAGRAFTPEQHDQALAQFGVFLARSRERSHLSSRLTARERTVLVLIVEGLTTRQMASRLGISERTVQSHVGATYRKLSVRTRVQAATRALETGIADLRPRPRPATAVAPAAVAPAALD